MPSLRTSLLVLVGAFTLASGVVALRTQQRVDPGGLLPALPEEPQPVLGLLELVPFVLDEPAVHSFRLESPSYDAGYLVALHVPTERVPLRQGYEPVLCAGRQTLARQNLGGPENVVIALLPAPRKEGAPYLDWSRTPIWYAAAELPERVDAAWLERELARALQAGLGPFTQAQVEAALAAGGPLRRAATPVDLNLELADLVQRHSPGEVDLLRGLRVPITR